jgi:predicted GIY-YIG superfamily endonuclease
MKTNIYILRLEGGRYYIGKSDNVMSRYQDHLNGTGSAWTKKFKPIGVEKIIQNASPFDEDKYTKEYMSKYGMNKVRGGSYVEVTLSDFHIDALNMEIWAAKDLCTNCGRSGHFANYCKATKDVNGNQIEYVNDQSSKENITYSAKQVSKNHNVCYRCGRPGHYSSNCYAQTDAKGFVLESDDDEDDDEDEDDYSEYSD